MWLPSDSHHCPNVDHRWVWSLYLIMCGWQRSTRLLTCPQAWTKLCLCPRGSMSSKVCDMECTVVFLRHHGTSPAFIRCVISDHRWCPIIGDLLYILPCTSCLVTSGMKHVVVPINILGNTRLANICMAHIVWGKQRQTF